jgi:hypothetical protein
MVAVSGGGAAITSGHRDARILLGQLAESLSSLMAPFGMDIPLDISRVGPVNTGTERSSRILHEIASSIKNFVTAVGKC